MQTAECSVHAGSRVHRGSQGPRQENHAFGKFCGPENRVGSWTSRCRELDGGLGRRGAPDRNSSRARGGGGGVGCPGGGPLSDWRVALERLLRGLSSRRSSRGSGCCWSTETSGCPRSTRTRCCAAAGAAGGSSSSWRSPSRSSRSRSPGRSISSRNRSIRSCRSRRSRRRRPGRAPGRGTGRGPRRSPGKTLWRSLWRSAGRTSRSCDREPARKAGCVTREGRLFFFFSSGGTWGV